MRSFVRLKYILFALLAAMAAASAPCTPATFAALGLDNNCGGGAAGGPNTFDAVTALEQWVEHGVAPDQRIASRVSNGVVTRTRPICACPNRARYIGTGSIDDASNFVCKKGGWEDED